MENVEKVEVGNFAFSFTDKRSTLYAQHFHDSYEIAYYVKADIKCFVSDTLVEIRDGDILFIKEFDIHKFFYNDDVAYIRYNIHFKQTFIADLLKSLKIDSVDRLLNRSPSIKLTPTLQQKAEIESILKLSHGNLNSQPLSQVYLIALLDLIHKIGTVNKPVQYHSQKDQIVKDIIKYVDQNYMSSIDLVLLEKQLHLSKYYLCHTFKEITQTSINQYVQLRRASEAQKMLIYTNKTISDICYECGFQNEQHFYRVFKKIANTTPARYRVTMMEAHLQR